MKSRNIRMALVIGEENDICPFGIYGGVVGRRNGVFATVTRSDGEGRERGGMQQLFDAGDHAGSLSQIEGGLNRRERPLFVAERRDGVDLGRTAGGEVTGEEGDDDDTGGDGHERDGVVDGDAEEDGAEETGEEEGGDEAGEFPGR